MLSIDCFQEYIGILTDIQENILIYLDADVNIEENYQNLYNKFEQVKIRENKHELRLLLHLLVNISNNHHRCHDFFKKIERILQFFKNDITKHYTNNEIFNIFESNKRILLYLFEENIITVNELIIQKLLYGKYSMAKYPLYFTPEIKKFIKEHKKSTSHSKMGLLKKLPDDFNQKRKTGESDFYICTLIQQDLVKEFIEYVNRTNFPLSAAIKLSIYGTNSFLIKKMTESTNHQRNKDVEVTLIKYAAFYGSIQIFQYLLINNVELTPSLWLYAIHGENPDIIHLLEENNVQPIVSHIDTLRSVHFTIVTRDEKTYEECFKESIKCHHNDIANYIENNYLKKEKEGFIHGIKYYNFSFINDFTKEHSFYYLCRYDYYSLVNILLNNKSIDINKVMVIPFDGI